MPGKCVTLIAAAIISSTLFATVAAQAPEVTRSAGRPDFHGIWMPEDPHAPFTPLDGQPVPLTPEGKIALATNAAKLQDIAREPVDRNDLRRCLPWSPTHVLQAPYPMQIVQRGDLVVFIFEHNHIYETVYFHEAADPVKDSDPSYSGYAVGRWEGEDMIVENSNFNDQTVLDRAGMPHGEQLVISRHFRKIDGGRKLEIVSTITDPEMYTRPWQVRSLLVARPDLQIEEYVCGQATLETRYTRRGIPEPN